MSVLNWINLNDDFLPLVFLDSLLIVVGGQVSRQDGDSIRITRRVSYGAFILYAGAAIFSEGASGPFDFVGIIVRAILAAGLVYGVALILMPVIQCVLRLAKLKRAVKYESKPWAPQSEPLPQSKPLAIPDNSEAERKAKVNDARAEVTAFYDKHEEIHEAIPAEMFRSQINARFSETIKSDQAWLAAQEMIADMLLKIAHVRERKRVEQEEARQAEVKAKEEERKRNEPEEKRQAVRKLTEWYQQEKDAIEQRLPEGRDREDVLRELFTRYDRLMKEALQEIKP